MKKNLYIIASDLLSSGQKLVLARTIKRSGSTPRDVGSMCIVTEDGRLFGTVGGGLLEHQVQQKAIEILSGGKSFIFRFMLTEKDLAKAGMICGGTTDLYLEPFSPQNPETVLLFEAVKSHIIQRKAGLLVTRIADGISCLEPGTRFFIRENGSVIGSIPGLVKEDIQLEKDRLYDFFSSPDNSLDFFVEKIAMGPGIILFGAGHVSVCVAQLAKMVGFNVTVVDDRSEFANKERFPDADEIVITDFKTAFEKLDISPSSYILIITRGHLYDKIVLQRALETSASYIGMIGSIKKRNTIYNALMEEGFTKETLEKVYSPIGLEINAETPEEIAVSIVGELIQKRAPKKKSMIL